MKEVEETTPLMTDAEIKATFGISRPTLNKWRKKGALPQPITISRRHYTPREAVLKLMKNGDGSKTVGNPEYLNQGKKAEQNP